MQMMKLCDCFSFDCYYTKKIIHFSSRCRIPVVSYEKQTLWYKGQSFLRGSFIYLLNVSTCWKLQVRIVNVKCENSAIRGLDLLPACYLLSRAMVTSCLGPGHLSLLLPVLGVLDALP